MPPGVDVVVLPEQRLALGSVTVEFRLASGPLRLSLARQSLLPLEEKSLS